MDWNSCTSTWWTLWIASDVRKLHAAATNVNRLEEMVSYVSLADLLFSSVT